MKHRRILMTLCGQSSVRVRPSKCTIDLRRRSSSGRASPHATHRWLPERSLQCLKLSKLQASQVVYSKLFARLYKGQLIRPTHYCRIIEVRRKRRIVQIHAVFRILKLAIVRGACCTVWRKFAIIQRLLR